MLKNMGRNKLIEELTENSLICTFNKRHIYYMRLSEYFSVIPGWEVFSRWKVRISFYLKTYKYSVDYMEYSVDYMEYSVDYMADDTDIVVAVWRPFPEPSLNRYYIALIVEFFRNCASLPQERWDILGSFLRFMRGY